MITSALSIDTPERRSQLMELVAVHYQGCDQGDLALATSMMLDDVLFTLPPLGQRFPSAAATRAGLAEVITKLPAMVRHRPAGFRFAAPDAETLRAQFTTHIMSCLDGAVFAIGDITVDAVLRDGRLRVRAWEVRPIFFRGLIHGGRLAPLPRLLLRLAPFILPAPARELFRAVDGGR